MIFEAFNVSKSVQILQKLYCTGSWQLMCPVAGVKRDAANSPLLVKTDAEVTYWPGGRTRCVNVPKVPGSFLPKTHYICLQLGNLSSPCAYNPLAQIQKRPLGSHRHNPINKSRSLLLNLGLHPKSENERKPLQPWFNSPDYPIAEIQTDEENDFYNLNRSIPAASIFWLRFLF